MLTRGAKIGENLIKKPIYEIILGINESRYMDPFNQYLKASELFFIRDIFLYPTPLENSIKKHNLEINLKKYLERIYG